MRIGGFRYAVIHVCGCETSNHPAEFGLVDPVAGCVTGRLGNLELDRARGLLLHYCCAGRDVCAMADVAHPHLYQVAGPQRIKWETPGFAGEAVEV